MMKVLMYLKKTVNLFSYKLKAYKRLLTYTKPTIKLNQFLINKPI